MNRRNLIRTVAGAIVGALLLNVILCVQLGLADVIYAIGNKVESKMKSKAENKIESKVESKDFQPEMSLDKGNIRVALFANLRKGSPGQTSLVTLSSTSSLQIEPRIDSTTKGSIGLNGERVRLNADDYKVKLLETDDAAVAQTAIKKVQSTEPAYIIQVQRRGQARFIVYVGSYENGKLANEAVDKLRRLNGMSLLLRESSPAVVGPHYVQAGCYHSQAKAESVKQSLLDANMDAYVVTLVDGGIMKTAVWVGQTATEAQLSTIQPVISNKGFVVETIQAQGAIIHSVELSDGKQIPHYRIYGKGRWVIKPIGSTIIKVDERNNRMYRGAMEVSLYNEKLALVNEVPLEQYVLSVVGSEVPSNWPMETLKAQAVAARTFALFQGNKFEIANVVDTELSQAYSGVEKEYPAIKKAVKETAGEVLMCDGKLIEAIYHSSAGGKTADPMEVWGGSYKYFQSVDSSDEHMNEVTWVRGPYSAEQITGWLKNKTEAPLEDTVKSLVVTERGPSGRVIGVEANGKRVKVTFPNQFRYIFGNLPSTLFDIIPKGVDVIPDTGNNGTKAFPIAAPASFSFVGKGNGHGIGMSQRGARELAHKGYDHKAILQYYYKDVELVKR